MVARRRVARGPRRRACYLDVQVDPAARRRTPACSASAIIFNDVTAARQLQDELEHANRQLEAAYEELQSTNEELETTNEELQSTVEELETTNEELQSTNEELETMNEELQSTNDELQPSTRSCATRTRPSSTTLNALPGGDPHQPARRRRRGRPRPAGAGLEHAGPRTCGACGPTRPSGSTCSTSTSACRSTGSEGPSGSCSAAPPTTTISGCGSMPSTGEESRC